MGRTHDPALQAPTERYPAIRRQAKRENPEILKSCFHAEQVRYVVA
jgi:hypothetical protein